MMNYNILSSSLFRKVLLVPAISCMGFAILISLYVFQYNKAEKTRKAYSSASKAIELIENAQGLVYEINAGESSYFMTLDPLIEKRLNTNSQKLTQTLTRLYQLDAVAQEQVQPLIDKILSYGQLLKENQRLILGVHPYKSPLWKDFEQNFKNALANTPAGEVQNVVLDYYLLPLQFVKSGFRYQRDLPRTWPQGLEHIRSTVPNPTISGFADTFQKIWIPIKEIIDNVKDQEQIMTSIHASLEEIEENLHQKMGAHAAQLSHLGGSSLTWFLVIFIAGSIMILMLSVRLAYQIARPIFRLTQQMTQLKDGQRLDHIHHTHRTDEIGDLARTLDIFRNRAQDIHQLQKQLQVSLQESRRQNKIRNELMDQMSHEIRTPLTAIINYSEGIIQSVDNGTNLQQLRDNILHIAASGQHLLSMVDTMIQIANQEEETEITLEDFNVRETIQLTLPQLEPIILKNENKFNVHCTDPSLRMHSDVKKLCRLLTKLITLSSNSIKSGRILLEVTLTQANDQDKVLFKVTDSGAPLTSETLNRLHEPLDTDLQGVLVDPIYYQLIDVKRTIDQLNGELRANNTHLGRTFSVILPRTHYSAFDDFPVRFQTA